MATPPDLSLDALMNMVIVLFNWLVPTVAVILGTSLGSYLLTYLAREINKLKLIR